MPKAVVALGKIGPASPLYWQARLRIAALDAQEDRFDQAVRKLKVLVAEKPDRIDAALSIDSSAEDFCNEVRELASRYDLHGIRQPAPRAH